MRAELYRVLQILLHLELEDRQDRVSHWNFIQSATSWVGTMT